jgi:hypothetical protein
MNPPKTPATPRSSPKPLLVLGLLLLPFLTACATFAPRALPVTAEDNTARLARHPQFQAAAAAAPVFVLETFDTITRLERQHANRTP